MELLQLQYFQVIARTQNISAANELHISQPSLSQLLKRLEQEVGTPLFNRVGKRIELNPCGAIFLKYVNEVFIALDNAVLEIRTLNETASKTVSLNILAASMLLPELYHEIKRKDPSVLLHILQDDQEHLPYPDELIISSDWKVPADASACHILLEEEIRLALPLGHPLLSKPSICLNDLTDEPFISLSPDSSLTCILSHYFAGSNYTPNITTYIDNPDIMRKLLNARIGLAFIPTLTWHGFSSSSIILRKVDDLPMKRFLLLQWNPDAFLTPSVLLCRDVIIRYFSKKHLAFPTSTTHNNYRCLTRRINFQGNLCPGSHGVQVCFTAHLPRNNNHQIEFASSITTGIVKILNTVLRHTSFTASVYSLW